MINKGELYMEHENIDETTRYLTACENVKKNSECDKINKNKILS